MQACLALALVCRLWLFLWLYIHKLWQGDVESIASKNPKELTALLEQISGSDELKKDYEDLEEQKAQAEEKSALVYQEKRTIVMERKQKKAQKEEAEKHMLLQEELVRVIVFVSLFLFLSSYCCSCLQYHLSPWGLSLSLKVALFLDH